MPLSTAKLPNFPLTGPELKSYAVQLMVNELEMRGVPQRVIEPMKLDLSRDMGRDFLFRAGTSYPLTVVQIAVQLHYTEEEMRYNIEPSFFVQNPMAPKHVVIVRSSHPVPPLNVVGGHVECFTLTAKTEQPNNIRVHYSIPIQTQTRIPPKPGEMFGTFETEEHEYSPDEVPAPEDPIVHDELAEFSEKWGIDLARPLASGAQAGGDAIVVGASVESPLSLKRKHTKGRTQ